MNEVKGSGQGNVTAQKQIAECGWGQIQQSWAFVKIAPVPRLEWEIRLEASSHPDERRWYSGLG